MATIIPTTIEQAKKTLKILLSNRHTLSTATELILPDTGNFFEKQVTWNMVDHQAEQSKKIPK